jgi:hypothetical protein
VCSKILSQDPEDKILIVLSIRDNINEIARLFKTNDGFKCGIFTNDTDPDKKIKELNKNIILSTLKSSGAGMDIKNLRCIINFVPFKSSVLLHQLMGRLRYIEGKALLQYVTLKIEMPANKIIDNIHIFAEYKSTAENVLKLPLNESGYIITKIYDLQETLDYRLKDLGINDVSNINDIELYIRASRDIDKLEIWYDWQRVHIKDDLTLREYLKFYNVRFMQLKIVVKSRKAYIKFDHLDVEVI